MTSDRTANAGVPFPAERAFVIQLRAPAAKGELFVGRAEHIASGVAARFGSIEELIGFVMQVLSKAARQQPHQEEDEP